MNFDIIFSEKQKFNQWWLWLLLLGIAGIIFFSVLKDMDGLENVRDQILRDPEILIALGACLLPIVFFRYLQLETKIRKDGIYVRFFPFHLSWKSFTWDKIEKAYIREYSPIGDYGGWGIRYGLFGKGKAYNVSGTQGLQLEFKNGKKLLIGTQKPEELSAALIKLGRYHQ
jgi:hypothetical protein